MTTHLAVWKAETYESPTERRWFRFVADVERLAGLDTLDGNEREDGYSLDGAYDDFLAGETAAEYAADIMRSQP